jgi:RimJ/RimL family protein N-acetyltransferase
MRFVLTGEVREFAERTGALFRRRIECNIHATVLQQILDGRHAAATFAYGLDDDDDVAFAALRTPPWSMLATELEPCEAAAFIERWLEADPRLPGVNALPWTARAIAAAWAESTGGITEVRMRQAMHVLGEVRDPLRPTPGGLRRAADDERALLAGWMRAFAEEAGVLGGDRALEIVGAQLSAGRLFVWDDDAPVSMLGIAPRVSGVTRIGPVYTPPEYRCRGYATSMVAAASRHALGDGADRCMLYTDLANPTSNKIYAEIGYRRIADWEEHAFEVAAS